MANSTAPEDPDFKTLMTALSIISETNKYINNCINQSYNTAKIKLMEQRITIKASRGQPDLVQIYRGNLNDAKYVDELPVSIILKRGVKKKTVGCIAFFTNMLLVAIQQRVGFYKSKRLYTFPNIKIEDAVGVNFQITALQKTNDPEIDGPSIPNTSIRFHCENVRHAREIIDKIEQLKEAIQTNRVFGIDLNTIIERENNELRVPKVLQILCDYILEHCKYYYYYLNYYFFFLTLILFFFSRRNCWSISCSWFCKNRKNITYSI